MVQNHIVLFPECFFSREVSSSSLLQFIFEDKLQKGRTGHLSEKKNIRETRSADHRRKSGRPKHPRAEKKVTTVN